MKKKIWLILIISFVVVFSIVLSIIGINNSKKYNISNKEYKMILNNFDNYNDYTVDINCLNNDNLNRKIFLDRTKFQISKSNEMKDDIFYELHNDKIFRFYYEDNKWKRKEVDSLNLDYELSFNHILDEYSELKFDKEKNEYFLNNINDYLEIRLTFHNNKITSYYYKTNLEEYKYSFSYYDNTLVEFPLEYSNVYDKLTLENFNSIINNTENVNNFSYIEIYNDIMDDLIVESYSVMGYYNEKECLTLKKDSYGETKNYYILNNNMMDIYSYSDKWNLETSNPVIYNSFNQKQVFNLEFIIDEYGEVIFNEEDNSYSFSNVSSNDKLYDNITIRIENGYIVEVESIYSIDNHSIKNIFTFNNINNTIVEK